MKAFHAQTMSIKVTRLPDAERRPRHIAIGTFDGVHVGHRQVIDRADTVLTFEPHPRERAPPGGGPQADHAVRDQARRDRGPGRRGARRDPVRRRVLQHPGRGLLQPASWSRRSGARAGLGGGELPLRRQGEGRPGDARRARRVRVPRRAAGRGRGRDRLLEPDPVAGRGGRGRGRRPGASERRSCSRGRSSRATAGVARSASRPPTWCPPTTWSAPGTGCTPRSPTASRQRSTSACGPPSRPGAACSSRPILIDYEGDLYGQTLRVAFIGRLRGERRFPGVEELIAQMHRDVEAARELCASFTPPR